MIIEKPVKMTDDVVKKMEEVFAMDGTVEEACFWANISKQSYYNWIDSFPEYKKRFDALRQRPFLKARQTIVKNLDTVEVAKWYMERKKKKEFGNNVDLTSDGDKIIPILNNLNVSNNDSDKKDSELEEEN